MYAEFIATLATSEIHHSRVRVGETTIIPVDLSVLEFWDVKEVELCVYISGFLYVAMWVYIRISGERCFGLTTNTSTHAT